MGASHTIQSGKRFRRSHNLSEMVLIENFLDNFEIALDLKGIRKARIEGTAIKHNVDFVIKKITIERV
jgi:hypothetical protein